MLRETVTKQKWTLPLWAKQTFHSLSTAAQKLDTLWLGLGVTVLGTLLGLSLNSALMNLTVSIVGNLIYLFTIVVNPLNGLLLWIVSSPFGELYLNISLGQSVPDLSPARFCVAFLCALLLAQTAIRKRKLAPFTSTDMMGVLLMAGLGLSIINAYSKWQETIQVIFDNYIVPLLVYFFAKNLITRRQDVDKVAKAVLFFGVYAALYAIYENQTGNILFRSDHVTFTQYSDSGLHVLRGLLDRSDHFGALFSMVIPLNFYLYLKAPTATKKTWYAITLAILFIGIFFTYKRTAWIAIIVSFFIIQLFYKQFRRLFFVLLLVFLVVLGATWNDVSQSEVVTNRINSKLSTVEGRTEGWNAAISLWARQPFFGYGFGNYGTVAQELGVQDTALESAHLDVLFGTGLFGFVPYVAWFICILWDSIRLFRKTRQNGAVKPDIDQDLLIIFWGMFLGYLINYTTTVANVSPVTLVFYLLIGSLVGSQVQFLSPGRSER